MAQDDPRPHRHHWPAWTLSGLAVGVAIGAYGLVRFDMTAEVDYRLGRVLAIQQVPGGDLTDRLVVTDLGDYQRAIRVKDPYLRLAPGGPACVRRSTMALRRWTRHAIVLQPFCRALGVPAGDLPSLAAPARTP